jgi:hypothetical protein
MYAAAEGHSTLGIPKKVGEDFVNASHGVRNLPQRAPSPRDHLAQALKKSYARKGR